MLALVLLAGTLALAVTVLLAWLTYTVATLLSKVAYLSELKSLKNSFGALAHGVQQAHYRATTGIDRASSLAEAANEKGVEVDARVDAMLRRVNRNSTKARRNENKIADVEAVAEVAASGVATNDEAIGGHDERIQDMSDRASGYLTSDALEDALGVYSFVGKNALSALVDLDAGTLAAQSLTLASGDEEGTAKRSLKLDGQGNLQLCSAGEGPCSRVVTDPPPAVES